jgi:DNA-binding response OmpR family regulator
MSPTKQQQILVIEDDPAIRRGVLHTLRFNGYATMEAPDGTQGLQQALESEYDLLLLDLVLPGHDGLEILRRVRAQSTRVPVIILTARGDEDDRVQGLKLGADDYVVKPFSVKELMARIESVLRRSPERPAGNRIVALRGCNLDLGNRELRFDDGETGHLSERETELLSYLIGNADRAVTRDEILARVWRMNPDALETRTVDMHIARLREKLRDDPQQPRIILTLRGRGYQFNAP